MYLLPAMIAIKKNHDLNQDLTREPVNQNLKELFRRNAPLEINITDKIRYSSSANFNPVINEFTFQLTFSFG